MLLNNGPAEGWILAVWACQNQTSGSSCRSVTLLCPRLLEHRLQRMLTALLRFSAQQDSLGGHAAIRISVALQNLGAMLVLSLICLNRDSAASNDGYRRELFGARFWN